MSGGDDKRKARKLQDKDARAASLKEALRENLHKRKAQARARTSEKVLKNK